MKLLRIAVDFCVINYWSDTWCLWATTEKKGIHWYNYIHISMWFSQKSTVLHIVLFEFDTPVKLVRTNKMCFTEACNIW